MGIGYVRCPRNGFQQDPDLGRDLCFKQLRTVWDLATCQVSF
jgi:hypothetical protein